MSQTLPPAQRGRVISRCLPCGLSIYEVGGLKKHKRTKAHIDKCIEEGLYCLPCKKSFVDRDEKETHFTGFHNSNEESMFAGVSVSGPNLWGHATSLGSSSTMDPPPLAPTVLSQCVPCGLLIYETGGLKKHKKTTAHTDKCIEEGFYCFSCKKTFLNTAQKDKHHRRYHNPDGLSVSVCLDCGVVFSKDKLGKRYRNHATQDGSTCSTNSTLPVPEISLPPEGNRISQCIPCGLRIPTHGLSGLRMHKRTKAHIDKCIEEGVYCFPCMQSFTDRAKHDAHFSKRHDSNGPNMSICLDCGVSFSTDNLRKRHRQKHADTHGPTPTRNIRPPALERKIISRCIPCGVSIYDIGGLKKHKKTKDHIDRFIEEGLYCIPCKKTFASKSSTDDHHKKFHDPNRAFEFGCLDCGQSFSSNTILKRHIRGHAAKLEIFSCEPCGKEYNKRSDLYEHLRSESHLRLKCFGGSKCDRTFATPSAMIMHLESGACKSNIDRKGIDQLLQQHDTTNIITITGAPAVAQQLPAELPQLITAHHAIVEVLSDSDSDSETGVILTPTSSQSPFFSAHNSISISEDGVLLTPSMDGSLSRRDSTHTNADGSFIPGGAHTPSSGAGFSEVEFHGGLMALLICPVCRKKFSSSVGLQMHISSPVHSPPIYHCPLSFLELGAGGKERNFKTLSALVQHLEHGSCEGGVETFKKAMEYVQGRMITLGLGNMQLLEYVRTSSA